MLDPELESFLTKVESSPKNPLGAVDFWRKNLWGIFSKKSEIMVDFSEISDSRDDLMWFFRLKNCVFFLMVSMGVEC